MVMELIRATSPMGGFCILVDFVRIAEPLVPLVPVDLLFEHQQPVTGHDADLSGIARKPA